MTETLGIAVEPEPRLGWPMTAEAREALARELELLHAEMLASASVDRLGNVVRLPVRHTRERVETLRRVLAGAVVIDDPAVAAIGRRVAVADDDAEVLEIALVLPGDGDAVRGWVSADAPLGAALLGAAAGDTVVVHAPAGRWTAHVRAVR
jgi:transcription elongation GreA/GreB family factor